MVASNWNLDFNVTQECSVLDKKEFNLTNVIFWCEKLLVDESDGTRVLFFSKPAMTLLKLTVFNEVSTSG